MPKIDIGSIPARSMTIYPEPFAKAIEGRKKQALGDAANLTQAQKDKLIDAFSARLDAARNNRNWEEVTHYSRLIDILSKRRQR